MVQGIEEGTKILLNEGVAVLAHGQEQPGVDVTGRSGRGRSQSAVIKKRVEPRQEFTVQSFSSDSPGNGADAYRPRLITLVFEGPLGNPRASGPLTQHNAQSRHAPHFSLCCSSAVQVLSLEPNPARLEASVHSSLVLKHFTAGEH